MSKKTDEAFRAVIEAALPAWRVAVAAAEGEQAAGVRYGASVVAKTKLAEDLVAPFEGWWGGPLDKKLGLGSEISGRFSLFPSRFCWFAMERAVEQGTSAALNWLEKVLNTRKASGRLVAEITGLRVSNDAILLPGFEISPCQAKVVDPFADPRLNFLPSPGARVSLAIPNASFIAPMAQDKRADVSGPYNRIGELVAALGLLGGAPRLSTLWFEYDDPDLEQVASGARFYPFRGVGHSPSPELNTVRAAEMLPKYVKLEGKVKHAVDLALDRLISARIHSRPGDKALDGGIALEALFLDDDEKQELTYRLALRAAVFLSDTMEDRKDIRAKVKSFYSLRSAVAHGGQSAGKVGAGKAELIEFGLSLAELAANKICEIGAKPDWKELELRL